MLKIFVIVSTLCTTVWALKFENCATDSLTKAFHWLHLDMYPLPVKFPGQLNMYVDIQNHKNLTNPLVDIELYKAHPGGGNAARVPCVPGTNIGSCQNIDMCTIIDRMNNKVDKDTPSFQGEVDKILLTIVGNHIQCHTLYTSWLTAAKHATISLQSQPPAIHRMLQGDYMIQISVKDDSSTDYIGCIEFNFTIEDAPPPPAPPTPATVTFPPTTTLGGPLPPSTPPTPQRPTTVTLPPTTTYTLGGPLPPSTPPTPQRPTTVTLPPTTTLGGPLPPSTPPTPPTPQRPTTVTLPPTTTLGGPLPPDHPDIVG